MRTLARECVYKFLFSKLFNPADEGLFSVLCKTLDERDKKFAEELLKAATENETVILKRIFSLMVTLMFCIMPLLTKSMILRLYVRWPLI